MRIYKLFAGLCIAFLLISSAYAGVDKSRRLKVALILPGPIADGTYNASAAAGIRAVQAKYPNISVSIRENTDVSQSESALLDYARNGYDVIIGHGFQFAEPAKKLHNQFLKSWFIITTAKLAEAPNLASFDNKWGDVGYVAGALAGLLTRSNTIAYSLCRVCKKIRLPRI